MDLSKGNEVKMMQGKNDLALDEFIEFDNDKIRRQASWKMLVSFVVLAIVYTWRPFVLEIWHVKNAWAKNFLVIILLIVLAVYYIFVGQQKCYKRGCILIKLRRFGVEF